MVLNGVYDIKGKEIKLAIITSRDITILHTLLYFPSVFYMHILQPSYNYAIYGFECYFLIL